LKGKEKKERGMIKAHLKVRRVKNLQKGQNNAKKVPIPM
jgi:hypothetical protein